MRNIVSERPWLVDDLDVWLEAYFSNDYRCALIFVDNSGADVLLGVLPFAREFIRRHSKVIAIKAYFFCVLIFVLRKSLVNKLVSL